MDGRIGEVFECGGRGDWEGFDCGGRGDWEWFGRVTEGGREVGKKTS